MAVWLPRYRLNCHTCTKTQKLYRGCEANALQPFTFQFDEEEYKILNCPIKLITPFTIKVMRYHRFYQSGFLPSQGGLNNQSARLLDAFEIIDNELNKIKLEEEKIRNMK